MATLNLYLRPRRRRDGKKLVYIRYFSQKSSQQVIVDLSTEVRVYPEDWDAKKQKVKTKRDTGQNAILQMHCKWIQEICQESILGRVQLTPTYLRNAYKLRKNPQSPMQASDGLFFIFLYDYYENLQKRDSDYTTLNRMKVIIDNLQDFETYRNRKINFRDINVFFKNELIEYYKQVHNHKQSTIHAKFKIIRRILENACEKGLYTRDLLHKVNFKLDYVATKKRKSKKQLKKTLLELFRKSKIDECFSTFKKNQIISDELINVESQWNNLRKLKITGQINVVTTEENRVRTALQKLINEIE